MAAAVGVGLVLRVVAASDLWLDETLSVNIARLSPGEMVEALRHDGHPPLYYGLLHLWMLVFGQGDAAVRSMSTVFSIATLPLIWRVGGSIGGRRCAVAALVLMATSPQAVRYASETRMYSLVVLLATAGWLLLRAALRRPTWGRLAMVTVISGAMLLTHYWSAYLLVAVATLLALAAWRGSPSGRPGARRTLVAVVAGAVFFVPWFGVFFDQITTTGAPWAGPARPAQAAFSLLVGNDPSGEAQMLGVVLALLAALALFARPVDDHRMEIDVRTRPGVRSEWALLALTLAFGVAGGLVGAVAFAARYTAVVLSVLLILAAMGIARLPSRPVRIGMVAVVATLGLVASLHTSLDSRTQVGEVATALRQWASPGDSVLICPDQLAPGVVRYSPDDLVFSTVPEAATPDRINWIHYRYRVREIDPVAQADAADLRAAERPIWLVWAEGYPFVGSRCEDLVAEVGRRRPRQQVVVSAARDGERAWLYRFDP